MFSLQFQVIIHHCRGVTGAKVWTVHLITPAVKAQRKNKHVAYLLADAQLNKFLYTCAVRNPYLENGATHGGLGLPTSTLKMIPDRQGHRSN